MRNKDYKTKMREKRKKKKKESGDGDKSEESNKDPRLKSYDYRSWDKFDVVLNGLPHHLLLSSLIKQRVRLYFLAG